MEERAFKACPVCLSPKRDEIDRSLTLGKSQRKVANEYGLAWATIHRHFHKHLAQATISALKGAETTRAGDLLAEVSAIAAQQQRLLDKAEASGDMSSAIRAGRELLRAVELTARLRGDIAANTTNINISASPDFVAIVALMTEFVDVFRRPELAERLALISPDLKTIEHEAGQ